MLCSQQELPAVSCTLSFAACLSIQRLVINFAGGLLPQAPAGVNGHVPALENGNSQLHEETASEASDQQPPLSPEPELDKYDHEQPLHPGPVASREQVGVNGQLAACPCCQQPAATGCRLS